MISKFYQKSPTQRRQILIDKGLIYENMLGYLAGEINDETKTLDQMSEDVIGSFRLPMGILTGIVVNGREHVVAMSTEEPSVIAAANRASRLINEAGGFTTTVEKPVTLAQILFVVPDDRIEAFIQAVMENKDLWLNTANDCDPTLVRHGGGAFDLTTSHIPADDQWAESFVEIRLSVHTVDAMGANIVNTMAEYIMAGIMDMYEEDFRCKRGMAIVSNAGDHRHVQTTCKIPDSILDEYYPPRDESLGVKIARASAFAHRSPYRAVTHNKGILNGIVAAAMPLGQDIRALEASAYDAACRTGSHLPLSTWTYDNHILTGQIEMPLIIGFAGAFLTNTAIHAAFELAQIDSYETMCGVLASIGLAQNLAALWALTTEGIQSGHMRLHLRKLTWGNHP